MAYNKKKQEIVIHFNKEIPARLLHNHKKLCERQDYFSPIDYK